MNAPIDPKSSAILLDVDGTVLDIAPTPDAVKVPNELDQVLTRLSVRAGGALAFVSGRSIADLDEIFSPLKLPIVGGHGAELRLNDGKVVQFVTTLDPALRKRLTRLAEGRDGVLIEDKGYSVAVHFRLAPSLGATLHQEVARICASAPLGSLEILPGKAVIEVKKTACNKGTGVRELMRHPPFRGRRPIFIGDDVTDEPVFKVVPEFHGIGFSVGRHIDGASGCFDGPTDVRQWLRKLVEAGDGPR